MFHNKCCLAWARSFQCQFNNTQTHTHPPTLMLTFYSKAKKLGDSVEFAIPDIINIYLLYSVGVVVVGVNLCRFVCECNAIVTIQ